MSERIDICPTWESILPLLVYAAERGKTAEARREAMGELMRLARIVDEQNAKAHAEQAEENTHA
jgi:hypothetical protein